MFRWPDQIRSEKWSAMRVSISERSVQCGESNMWYHLPVKWLHRKAAQMDQTHSKKCINTSESIQQVLLHVKATPIDAKLPSPAKLLMKRQITTSLPSHLYNLPDETINRRFEERSALTKKYYDRNAKKEDLPPLYLGKNVRILNKPSKTWCPGTVMQVWRTTALHHQDSWQHQDTLQQKSPLWGDFQDCIH